MKLLGIGGRKSNRDHTSTQGKKRWQHFPSQVESSNHGNKGDEEGSISKPRTSRSLERRNDGASLRHRTTSRGRSEKKKKGYNEASARDQSRETAKHRGRSTSHTRPTREQNRSRSRGDIERPISNSRIETKSRRRKNNKTGYHEDLRKSPDPSLQLALERLHDFSSSNQPTRQRLVHLETPNKPPTRRSTRILSQSELKSSRNASRSSNESAFTKWHAPAHKVPRRPQKKNQASYLDDILAERVVDAPANHHYVPGSSNIGVRSTTLQSPNGDGLQRDQPTTHTDRLVDVCLICEAVTAAPFLCLQIMFCADDGLLKTASKTKYDARARNNTPPEVIKTAKTKDQASVSVFTRETFGSTGGYLLCGGRGDTTRDDCSTPDNTSENSQNEDFRFAQKDMHRIDSVGIKHSPAMEGSQDAHDQLEEALKERLISTGKLDKELLKKLLEQTDAQSSKEFVHRKSSNSPASEMSNDSEETTDSDVVIVRGAALKGSPLADRAHDVSQSQPRFKETVIIPPSLRHLESRDRRSVGVQATHVPVPNFHTNNSQNRSTPISIRTPTGGRGKDALPFSSRPDDIREIRSEAPVTNIKSEESQAYVVPHRSTLLTYRSYTPALEQDAKKSPGSQMNLTTPPSLLQPAASCENRSHVRVSQENTIHNQHAISNLSTPIPLILHKLTRRVEAVHSQWESWSRVSLGGVPLSNQLASEKLTPPTQTRNAKINRLIPISNRARLNDDSASTTAAADIMDEWETLEMQLNGLLETGLVEASTTTTDDYSDRAAASSRRSRSRGQKLL